MLKVQLIFRDLPVHIWPVEGPDADDIEGLYKLDRRAQIWRYDPLQDTWEEVFRAPMVTGTTGTQVPRETGMRSMVVYQGINDQQPCLYVATWAVSRSPGALLLRSEDGLTYEPVSPYGIIEGLPVTATRVLIPFNGKLYTSPNGTRGYGKTFAINVSANPIVYETNDPGSGRWTPVSEPGFGDPGNEGVFMVCPFKDQLYAGTFNKRGYEIWRSECSGEPPYTWTRVLQQGGYRGPLNQVVTSMHVFKGALYIGSGIQNGGSDRVNNIGPAGSELIRINADDSWDLLVGDPRDTPDGKRRPLSTYTSGFGNVFNGYFWDMGSHDGWLYLGTMDSTIWINWFDLDHSPALAREFVNKVGVENLLAHEAGCDLWRSADGENWMPVTQVGFDNFYNLGVRKIISTPHGLALGVANVFGPRVAVKRDGQWQYEDNPRGGLEIWFGKS
jgi:hypothetical protein